MTRALLLAAVLAVFAGGCIIPEVPHYSEVFPTRRNVHDVGREFPVPGTTRLADVILRLGEPDLVERRPVLRVTYAWTKVVAEVVVAVPTPMGPAGGSSSPVPEHYTLIIEFDASNVVRAIPRDDRPPAPRGQPEP